MREAASKKQTPFSVWYPQAPIGKSWAQSPGLKEADAFQRLVYGQSARAPLPLDYRLKEAEAFQRLVFHIRPPI